MHRTESMLFADHMCDFSELAPLHLRVPGVDHPKLGRKAPVPIILPPPYDGDSPSKGLGMGAQNAHLHSATSTSAESVFSPTRTDGTQTPLTSVGSPGCFSQFGEDGETRKPSIDVLVESAVQEFDHEKFVALVEGRSSALAEPDSASPTTTIWPLEHVESARAVQTPEVHGCEVTSATSPSSAFSLSSDESDKEDSVSAALSTSCAAISASLPGTSADSHPISADNGVADSDSDSPWRRTLSESNLLNRAGIDAQNRRSRRSSPSNSVRAARAPIPMPPEASPPLAAHLAPEKIALDAFDDEKIMVLDADRSVALALPTPEQSYYLPWSGGASSAASSSPGPSSSSPVRLNPLSPASNPSVQRITSLHYAQSRHEYSKARRMMAFHLRERDAAASGAPRTMHIDTSNQNPSVLAAELHGQSHEPVKSELDGTSIARQLSVRQTPVMQPPSRQPSHRQPLSPSLYTSSFDKYAEEHPSASPSFFAMAFGACFGRSR